MEEYLRECTLNLPDLTLSVGEVSIHPSVSIRNLGAFFYVNMTMSTHINNVCRNVIFHLRNISRIRKLIYGALNSTSK